jgi:hypothetical protein
VRNKFLFFIKKKKKKKRGPQWSGVMEESGIWMAILQACNWVPMVGVSNEVPMQLDEPWMVPEATDCWDEDLAEAKVSEADGH